MGRVGFGSGIALKCIPSDSCYMGFRACSLSPNMAFILFSELSFIVYGLVLNLHFVLSADLSALNNAGSKNFVCLKLPDPDPICIFASRKNTTGDTYCHCEFQTIKRHCQTANDSDQ